MAKNQKPKGRFYRSHEFRPDKLEASFLKTLYLTEYQRRILSKWSLFAAHCIAALVLQDVIMARISILGATTDLVPAVILLITVAIGSEEGGVFALVASLIYFFAGTAPGPYSVALLPIYGLAGGLFRENFWRRGMASDVLCAGIALLAYEMTIFGLGIFTELTNWYRWHIFLITAVLSILVMLPLYPLVSKIHAIGGETWKE
jgi:hypothetical protein